MEESTNPVLDNNPPIGDGVDAAHTILDQARKSTSEDSSECSLNIESVSSPDLNDKSSLIEGLSEKSLSLEEEKLSRAILDLDEVKGLLDDKREHVRYLKNQYALEKSTLLQFIAEEQASGVRQKRVPWKLGFEIRDNARVEPPELTEAHLDSRTRDPYETASPRLAGYYTGKNYRMPLDLLCYVTPILYRYTVKDKYTIVKVNLDPHAKLTSYISKIDQNNFRNRFHTSLSSAIESVIYSSVRKLDSIKSYIKSIECWEKDLTTLNNSLSILKQQEGIPNKVPSAIKNLIEVASDLIKTEESEDNFDLKNLDL